MQIHPLNLLCTLKTEENWGTILAGMCTSSARPALLLAIQHFGAARQSGALVGRPAPAHVCWHKEQHALGIVNFVQGKGGGGGQWQEQGWVDQAQEGQNWCHILSPPPIQFAETWQCRWAPAIELAQFWVAPLQLLGCKLCWCCYISTGEFDLDWAIWCIEPRRSTELPSGSDPDQQSLSTLQ